MSTAASAQGVGAAFAAGDPEKKKEKFTAPGPQTPRQAPPATTSQASLGDTKSDWNGLIIAAITLIIVLLTCYMCVQLFKARRPAVKCPDREQFRGWVQYRPACSGQWLSERRGGCKGLTTGDMPSVEEDLPISWAPCSGALGVPPPTYQ